MKVNVAGSRSAAPFRLPSVAHYLDFVRTSASPKLQILNDPDLAAQQAAWAAMQSKLEAFASAGAGLGWPE